MYTITLPTFAGPLDLLLRLIERAELDITTIALAQVADQYLLHVRTMEEPDPHALAEFVSMAARLLLIKSRALLPRPTSAGRTTSNDEDADAEALARQLREYQHYKQLATILRGWQEEDRRTFLRTAPPVRPDLPPPPSTFTHTVSELITALQRRLQRTLPLEQPSEVVLPPRRTVADVAATVRQRLARQHWFSFDDLLIEPITRQDLIVAFWAILELLKRRVIVVEQDQTFGMISIGRGAALDIEPPLAELGEASDEHLEALPEEVLL
ncbi:segregation and condensation protein A [Candidatus Oscillochloris fontis]|uniref:segregation and condensation protein A n=1 Tax=Candidatus Oscillochloris fontis TaxID=2496868 RepID=UPI00101C50A1|nr:segregation/condensation protein A [Candidatus Oscillochloris fontis]